MKINKITLLLAAGIFAAPLAAFAQSAPQAAVVTSQAPGKMGEADAIQLQGKVKSINKKTREVTLVGPQGNQMVSLCLYASIITKLPTNNSKHIKIEFCRRLVQANGNESS